MFRNLSNIAKIRSQLAEEIKTYLSETRKRLNEVYFENRNLKVDALHVRRKVRNANTENNLSKDVFLSEIIEGNEETILIASPGVGLSFTAKQLLIEKTDFALKNLEAMTCKLEALEVPVWLTASELVTRFDSFDRRINRAIRDSVQAAMSAFDLSPAFYAWLEEEIAGRMIFVVIDEGENLPAADRETFSTVTEHLNSKSIKHLITYHRSFWENAPDRFGDQTRVFELMPFDNEEPVAFADQFFASQNEELLCLFQTVKSEYLAPENIRLSARLLAYTCAIIEEVKQKTSKNVFYEKLFFKYFSGSGRRKKPFWATSETLNSQYQQFLTGVFLKLILESSEDNLFRFDRWNKACEEVKKDRADFDQVKFFNELQSLGLVETVNLEEWRFEKAAYLYLLGEISKFKKTIRNLEYEKCRKVNWVGINSDLSMKDYYQFLPIFRRVRSEETTHGYPSVDGDSRIEYVKLNDFPFEIAHFFRDFGEVVRTTRENLKTQDSSHPASKIPRFIIIGEPGYGKSTLCDHLSWGCKAQDTGELLDSKKKSWKLETSAGNFLVPVRIDVQQWEQYFLEENSYKESFFENLSKYLSKRNLWSEKLLPSPDHWEYYFKKGEVLLLLDGLDELSEKSIFNEEIIELVKSEAFQNCSVIFTCRNLGMDSFVEELSEFPIFRLDGLTPGPDGQQEKLVYLYSKIKNFDPDKLLKEIEASEQLEILAQSPFLLILICFLFSRSDNTDSNYLPETKGRLFQLAVSHILNDRKKLRKIPSIPQGIITTDEKIEVLAELAYRLWKDQDNRNDDKNQKISFTQIRLNRITGEVLRIQNILTDEQQNVLKPSELINEFTRFTRIIVGEHDKSDFNFIHLNIYEYLVAFAIANRDRYIDDLFYDWSKEVNDNSKKDDWFEILAFLGRTLANLKGEETVEKYINLLLKKNSGIRNRPLFIAVRAILECENPSPLIINKVVDNLLEINRGNISGKNNRRIESLRLLKKYAVPGLIKRLKDEKKPDKIQDYCQDILDIKDKSILQELLNVIADNKCKNLVKNQILKTLCRDENLSGDEISNVTKFLKQYITKGQPDETFRRKIEKRIQELNEKGLG